MKTWIIIEHPFKSALLISTVYVIIGTIIARSDFANEFAFWVSAPVSMPIFVLFGLNGSPSNLEVIFATVGLTLIYTAVVWGLIKITGKMVG